MALKITVKDTQLEYEINEKLKDYGFEVSIDSKKDEEEKDE